MKLLSISYKGMEDITALEIKELLNLDSKIKESCVEFECSEEKLVEYCYKAQGVNRVLVLLDSFKISKVEDLERISKIDFSSWLKGRTYETQGFSTFSKSKISKTFAARCEIVETKLNKAEVESTTGEYIEGEVDLKNPDITVFVYIYNTDCYVGIDFSGDLSKRDYKIFNTKDDLKGTIAYALVRLSGYNNEKSFLNLDARSGVIAIEAALFGSGLSVNFFNKEKFNFLKWIDVDLGKFDKNPKKTEIYAYDSKGYEKVISNNSKIAGVEIKFENKDCDCVVSYIRGKSKISGLDKVRDINYGKSVLKIVSFKNA